MTLRKNTNPHDMDVAPELQNVLSKNGMQAHITFHQVTGEPRLTVLGHDSPVIDYAISEQQAQKLMDGGSNYSNKTAYKTFVDIVRKDFDVPDSFVSARNVGGRVVSGLHGYRIGDGEYGYRSRRYAGGVPFFSPFRRGGRGWGGDFLSWSPREPAGFHGRRIGGRFFHLDGPMVATRPDDRLKPGELRSGGYGFYYKGNRGNSQEMLDKINIGETKLQPLESAPRPAGKATPYKEAITSDLYFTKDKWNEVLKSHGVVIDASSKKMIIQSSATKVDLSYDLTDKEVKTIMADNIKGKNAVSIHKRLDVINNAMTSNGVKDFQSDITMEMLNSKNLINIELRPEVKSQVEAKFIERENQIRLQEEREAERRAFNKADNAEKQRLANERARINRDPLAVNGRDVHDIMGNYAFYAGTRNGREVVVGEVRVDETADRKFHMSAEINGVRIEHSITKEQYDNFVALDDEHRLRLFDDVFKEIKIGRDKGARDYNSPSILNAKDGNGNYITRGEADIKHSISSSVNGENLSMIKDNKGFYREIDNGREVSVGRIEVNAAGNDRYNMTAVIDGVEVTHSISQKQYEKFLAVDDYQRMKLFSKVFPEVDMKTRPGMGTNVGAAILAALVAGSEVAHGLAHMTDDRPERMPARNYSVYSKAGVVSPVEVAERMFSEQMDINNPNDNDMHRGV